MTAPKLKIVWEFVVRPEFAGRFEEAYGPAGDWARLFARHPGFLGTTLLRDASNPRRFLTIDSWESAAHFAAMRLAEGEEYRRLDEKFAEWTEAERAIGNFDVV